MLPPKKTLTKVTRPASDQEMSKMKMTPVMKLERKVTYQTPKSMPTKPASEVSSPKREFISKLNAAADKAKSYGRNVSSVSKEFDGKEVEGKRIESRGGKKVKEVYSMPGGGKRVEKERYNQAGNIVSRKIKDTKINPR